VFSSETLNKLRRLRMQNHDRKGNLVGQDQFGNMYYEDESQMIGQDRWVVYADRSKFDGSMVPSEWHGWLHHTNDRPPSQIPIEEPSYKKEHEFNFPSTFGTGANYVPPGFLLKDSGVKTTVHYQSWHPGSSLPPPNPASDLP